MRELIDKRLVLVNDRLHELQQETSSLKLYIQIEIHILENLPEYYRKSDDATENKIISKIFAGKIALENGRF